MTVDTKLINIDRSVNIEAMKNPPSTALSSQQAAAYLGHRHGDFPVTENLARQFLSLPIYPELRPEQVTEVVTKLEQVEFVVTA